MKEWVNDEKVLFYLYLIYIIFKKQMLQMANTDLFNPLVPKAHDSECLNLLFSLQIKPSKIYLADFYFLHPRH